MPNDHPTWEALGVKRGSHVRLIQLLEDSPPSVVADLSNPIAKRFVEEGLGTYQCEIV